MTKNIKDLTQDEIDRICSKASSTKQGCDACPFRFMDCFVADFNKLYNTDVLVPEES